MKHDKLTMFASSLVKKTVESFVNENNVEDPLFLVGLSGGADSLALALAASIQNKSKNRKVRYGAVIVNHKLQEVTDKVTIEAREKAEQLGLSPIIVKTVEIPENSKNGMEAEARNARYGAFYDAVKESKASGVLLAHTMNDNAEQVILGLLRGSGTTSISGIPSKRDIFLRPFIELRREDTEKICSSNEISFWEDPQNKDTQFTRVKVRHEVLPMIEEKLGSGIVQNLSKTSEIAKEDSESLDYIVNHMLNHLIMENSENISINFDKLSELPVGLRKRLIRKVLIEHFSKTLRKTHVDSVNNLVTNWNGQKHVSVPNGIVKKLGENLVFLREV